MSQIIRTVGFNAVFLDPGVSGGPETYFRELVRALARERPGVRLEIATTRRGAAALRAEGWDDLAAVHELPADEGERAARLLAEQVRVPRLARRAGWDVLHSLGNTSPLRSPVPTVVTVHDVIFMQIRTFGRVTTWGLSFLIRRAVPRADLVVTDSQASRQAILSQARIPPERVTVVPLGPGRPFQGLATPEDEVRDRFGLDGAGVVLCVAAKRPHKNQELLVRAAPHLGEGRVVVLAGHPEPYDRALRKLAARLGVADRVRFVDYVSDADLAGLVAVSGCLAIPTLAEGFGLPVLEGMRQGVPVACSDIPVLHEVAGDAARYFDPHDPGAAAAAIRSAYGDRALAEAGRRRAEAFSWEETARGTWDAYERAVAGRRG